jgi:geranylgeranyl diphosphate synthase type I
MATEDESLITGLRSFGHALGMTFQVHDDVLSIWGDEKATGKPSASDIQQRKKTLPVVYALERTRGANRKLLRQIYQKETMEPADVEEVLRVLNKLNTRGYTQDVSKRYYHLALSELDDLDLSQHAKEELKTIAAFFLSREY